jgi:uncharacterized membrane protein
MMRAPLWHKLPHVRTGAELSRGERAADILKTRFGSWPFLGILNTIFFGWIVADYLTGQKLDPGLLLLNLCLSWLAAQQGGALQISANRGDRISSELALSTHDNAQQILVLNQQQVAILDQQNVVMSQQSELLTQTAQMLAVFQTVAGTQDVSAHSAIPEHPAGT